MWDYQFLRLKQLFKSFENNYSSCQIKISLIIYERKKSANLGV